jgi:predicted Rossmann fold flavoprotein
VKTRLRVLVVGGGAAGFFGAIAAAERGAEVLLIEKGSEFLAKVRISGGGRCNVTHSCFEPRELSKRYPRGERALIGAFSRFQPTDTIGWFRNRGVEIKREADGRMFPVTDSSETIIECLLQSARRAGVQTRLRCGLERLVRCERDEHGEAGWRALLSDGSEWVGDAVLIATGGCRSGNMRALLAGLGHEMDEPVPSLFSFHLKDEWSRELAGISLQDMELSIPSLRLMERGAALLTHQGLSGPAILRLSAWGARDLAKVGYRFTLRVRWVAGLTEEVATREFKRQRERSPGKSVASTALFGVPSRLWDRLCGIAGIDDGVRWAILRREEAVELCGMLTGMEFEVVGKSLNKEEFVTCGGVSVKDVDFRTMESRRCSGLYFAGEVLDVDGITGGFNFQAAWTTSWLAGQAMTLGGR